MTFRRIKKNQLAEKSDLLNNHLDTGTVRWIILLIIVCVICGVVIYHITTNTRYQGPVQHVIFISLDTSRADHFGCYGNTWIQTPNIDRMANESILLTNFITVVTTTLSSHTSLLTGKYPHSHGVPRNGFMVHRDNLMLSEILNKAGFFTVGFIGSFALDSRFDFAQGFDHFDETFDILVGMDGSDQNQRTAESVTNGVINYLEEQDLPENLFLFVHYFDPHWPYSPPPPYDKMYGEANGPQAIKLENHPALLDGPRPDNEKEWLCQYAGEISYMDMHVGRLIDYLKKRDILDNSILVIVSDHGENLIELPSPPHDHGWTVYDIEIRAVGMIRLPKAARGGMKYESLTATIDILPTLTNYLELPTPAGIEGEPLDLLNLTSNPQRILFSEGTKPWKDIETDPGWFNIRKARCARNESFKYIQTQYLGTEELYDLAKDPREKYNLLSRTFSQWLVLGELDEAFRDWVAAAKPLPSRFEPSQQEETKRRLKSLGYL